jgi:hypothetical protein
MSFEGIPKVQQLMPHLDRVGHPDAAERLNKQNTEQLKSLHQQEAAYQVTRQHHPSEEDARKNKKSPRHPTVEEDLLVILAHLFQLEFEANGLYEIQLNEKTQQLDLLNQMTGEILKSFTVEEFKQMTDKIYRTQGFMQDRTA